MILDVEAGRGDVPSVRPVADLADGRVPGGLTLDPQGAPVSPVLFVDLGHDVEPGVVEAAINWVVAAGSTVTVGVSDAGVAPGLERLVGVLTCAVVADETSTATAGVPDVARATQAIAATVAAAPHAAVTLHGLLRLTEQVDVPNGLVAESLAYSMLLAGPEFARWRRTRPVRPAAAAQDEPAVVVQRRGATLLVELNRPDRHNAFGHAIRDGLADALDLARVDGSIEHVVLRGRGASFCSGGDLDEFGTAPNPSIAHLVRLDRSAGGRIERMRERVTVEVHGACIGAGVELPSFAGHVVAEPNAFFQLPELSMGLVPGAGGTVSLTRRIGRARTAYLALSGTRIDAATALRWGLVDAVR